MTETVTRRTRHVTPGARRVRGRDVAGAPTSPRGSLRARLRATARLAVRQVLRTPGASLLVVVLIALPITALAAGVTIFESHQPTPAQVADYTLGRAESRLQIVGGPNPTRTQGWTQSWATTDGDDSGPTPAGLPEMVPASASVVTVFQTSTPTIVTKTGIAMFTGVVGPVWEDDFAGQFRLLSGHAPAAPGEALATTAALARLGLAVGDTAQTAPEDGGEGVDVTITGEIAVDTPLYESVALVLPEGSPLITDAWDENHYVFGWQPSAAQIIDLNHAGYTALARDVILDPPAPRPNTGSDDAGRGGVYGAAFVGGAFFALLVGLIAGAAMSVSARRQQRSLAMAASVGAGRGSLFAVVLAQGLVLGMIAAAAGVLLGIGMAAMVLAVTNTGAPWEMNGNWGFHVPVLPIAAAAALAVAVGALAAILPARTATRGDTLAALRGARRPAALHRAMPRWGAGVLVAGLACALGAIALVTWAVTRETPVLSSDTAAMALSIAAVVLVIAGPALIILGLALSGHWLLTLLARAASRAGIATRLAVRDAAANPQRTVPAFLAVAAAVMVAAIALSVTSVTMLAQQRSYTWGAPLNSMRIEVWGNSPADLAAAVEDASAIARSTDARGVAVEARPVAISYGPDGAPEHPDAIIASAGARMSADECGDWARCIDGWMIDGGGIAVIAADDLDSTIDHTLSAADREAYEAGAVLVRAPDDIVADRTRLFFAPVDTFASGDRPQGGEWDTSGIEARDVPALAAPDAKTYAALVMAPATAAALGIATEPASVIATLDAPLGTDVIDKLTADAQSYSARGTRSMYVMQETGPQDGVVWLVLITVLAGVIVLGTAVVTLGLSRFERRPDDATLTAVGGRTSIRRRVNAVQALTIVGLSSVAGAAISLLPSFAFLAGGGASVRPADLPLGWIALLAVGLPLVISAIAWLVPPRESGLVRREAIT